MGKGIGVGAGGGAEGAEVPPLSQEEGLSPPIYPDQIK